MDGAIEWIENRLIEKSALFIKEGYMFKLLPIIIFLFAACAPLNFNPTNASLAGTVEIESAAGTYTIDLQTGLILGQCSDDIKVRKIEAVALVEDQVSSQYIKISEDLKHDTEWHNCTKFEMLFSGLEISKSFGCLNKEIK